MRQHVHSAFILHTEWFNGSRSLMEPTHYIPVPPYKTSLRMLDLFSPSTQPCLTRPCTNFTISKTTFRRNQKLCSCLATNCTRSMHANKTRLGLRVRDFALQKQDLLFLVITEGTEEHGFRPNLCDNLLSPVNFQVINNYSLLCHRHRGT